MINFVYESSDLVDVWRNVIKELAYGPFHPVVTWGLAVGFDRPIHIKFDDVLDDGDLQLDMAGFTTARWTRLMNLYFRSDLELWIKESAEVLHKYRKRPIVRGYQPNRGTEHSHGSCLQAINLRLCPQPNIQIISRACLFDRTGLIDLAVMNTIARHFMMHLKKVDNSFQQVSGDWIIDNAYVNSFTQAFHLLRFGYVKRDLSNLDRAVKGHIIGRQVAGIYEKAEDYESIKYGPMKRAAKRIIAWRRDGKIHRNKLIRELDFSCIKVGGLGDQRDSEESD